ncbi:MAG: VCBS repeat-containing protein [Verrucomicrobia bacterium]|nr:VCBS repeat-containing protein [Verrucomicrobiota bacterium]
MKTLLPALLAATVAAASAEPIRFERHEIANFRAGYQLAVADVNGDGKLDVIALDTETNRVDWFENPTWKQHPVAQTSKNIDLAPHDIDGDGRPEIALASGFAFNNSKQMNQIQWLGRAATLEQPWQIHSIATDPVVHRLRWGDLDGDGRAELIHAPIVGPGSGGMRNSKPLHLWAFRVPPKPAADPWKVWPIDESLTVLHGIWVGRLDKKDDRDEILTASAEGVHRFRFEGSVESGHWKKSLVAAGAPGASEVAPGKLGPGKMFIATIEPWHGNQAIVYTQPTKDGPWQRHVLDTTLKEGHALAVADFDGDGMDEIVVGWRAGGGGLLLFHATDATGQQFTKVEIERGVAAECAVVADMNGDGKLDLVVSAGRNNKILWYQNK